MPTERETRRNELVSIAATQRNEIANQLEQYRDVARIVETGFSLYRAVLSHKILVIAGLIGFTLARPRRVLRLAGYTWSLYKLVRSARRLLR